MGKRDCGRSNWRVLSDKQSPRAESVGAANLLLETRHHRIGRPSAAAIYRIHHCGNQAPAPFKESLINGAGAQPCLPDIFRPVLEVLLYLGHEFACVGSVYYAVIEA